MALKNYSALLEHLEQLGAQYQINIEWLAMHGEAQADLTTRSVAIPHPKRLVLYLGALVELGVLIHPTARGLAERGTQADWAAARAYAADWALKEAIEEDSPTRTPAHNAQFGALVLRGVL